ncbi:MAG TPA: thioredoxin [Candidatus Cloacimonadota bacterium]|nr:thioredoxin [Candidatus Cloacimonadota bacterium]
MLLKLQDKEFDSIVEKGIVLVDFYADWCGPCNLLSPVIDEIANKDPQLTILKINVDEHPDLAEKHGVLSIPTLLFFKDGVSLDSSIGVVSENVILNKIEILKN